MATPSSGMIEEILYPKCPPLLGINKIIDTLGPWDFYRIETANQYIEGPTNIEFALDDTAKRLHKLKSLPNLVTWTDNSNSYWPRIKIAFDDIDHERSFQERRESGLIRRFFAYYLPIYSKDGEHIFLHWLLGKEQIRSVKNTIKNKTGGC